MSNFNQNGIDFNITDYKPTKLGNRASTATYNALIAGKGSDIINSVEIDWNDAYMGNTVDPATLTDGEKIIISTTGQLLSYVSTIAQKLTTLENILINI